MLVGRGTEEGRPTLSSVVAGTSRAATTLAGRSFVPGSAAGAVAPSVDSCDAAADGPDDPDVTLTITMVPTTARTSTTGSSAERTGCRRRNRLSPFGAGFRRSRTAPARVGGPDRSDFDLLDE